MAEGTTINIYGSVTGENVLIGSHNQLNAAQFADAAPLPAFDKDAPIADAGSLPAGSHLPFLRNELFTGREAELKAIAESLLGRQTSAVIKQAVTGMGGMGKTQLAVEFGYRYGQFFRGVHWLNMANPESINSEIANCGMQMGLPNFPDDLPSQVILTVNTWKAHGPRLLILDNFEEVGLVNQVMKHFNHSNLRVLLTSRHSDWSPAMGLNPIPLDVFSAEESLVFLKKSQGRRRDTDEELSLLAERLGHLPLALELASRYLGGHPRLNVAGYLEQASHALDHPSMRNWRKDLPAPTEHDLSLVNTFALSWQAVEGEDAQKVFMSAGYLAPNEPIPLEIFEGALEISPDACDEATQRLIGLGLLNREENDMPSIHPLLAEYARTLGKDGKLLESASGAIATLSKKATDTEIPADFHHIKPHIKTVAEFAEEARLGDSSTLWNNYGYYLKMIADYSNARAVCERVLKIDEAIFGPDHPKVAIHINNLGRVMQDMGDLEGARAAFEHALRIEESTFGFDNSNIAIYANNLGNVLHDLGNLEGALTVLKLALKIDETIFGSNHPKVARDVNNLGNVLHDLGDLEGARAAFERALKIDEATFGVNHPNVARDINNLGNILQALGNLEDARIAFERALKIGEAVFGSDHPTIATYVNNLGNILHDLGDLEGAHAAFECALKIGEAVFGSDHPTIATYVNNLGNVYYALNDLESARAALERALEISEKQLGANHPNVATLVNNLGMVKKELGDLEGACTVLERALKIDETVFGPDHPNVARDVNNLGGVMQDLGNLQSARANYERALGIFKKFLPPDHPNIKTVQENLDALGLPSTNKNHE